MKALIRKNPDTPTKPAQDEVYLQPWLDWIDQETGRPLTDENYGYALCESVPDDHPGDIGPMDFQVTAHTRTETDPYGEEGQSVTVRYWTATYTPQPREDVSEDAL